MLARNDRWKTMWELIAVNRRKSLLLFLLMGLLLATLGWLIGAAVLGADGGSLGLAVAAVIWGVLSLLSYFSGDAILLGLSGAQEVTPEVHPKLFHVVEEMKIAAGLPMMPAIYLIDASAPNAFAVGRKPSESAIAVTTGLLFTLNRDELQGVVAHETAHIVNRDTLFMTFAGVMLGSIVLLSELYLRGMNAWLDLRGSTRYRTGRSSRGGGGAQALFAALALVCAVLAPLAARLLYFAISRRREYLADASAVRFTRYPEGLASALEKMAASEADLPLATKATAGLYIVNPLKPQGEALTDLSSTHPPISERIRILRAIAQGAGLKNYQAAYTRVTGRGGVIPAPALQRSADLVLRAASPPEPPEVSGRREQGDLIMAAHRYTFLDCACGLRLKMPPNLKALPAACPRCGRPLNLPAAVPAAAPSPETPALEKPPLVFQRLGGRWESFACVCGRIHQLSPAFEGKRLACKDCGREIRVTTLDPGTRPSMPIPA